MTPDPRVRIAPPAPSGAQDAELLFELARDLLARVDRDGRFVRVNPAWERVLGWPCGELIGTRVTELLHPEDLARTLDLAPGHGRGGVVEEFLNRYRCRDGSYRWLEWNACRCGDAWYGVARDVTERRQLEQRALRDPLTGLLNRAAFVDRLTHALTRLERSGGLVAVLFVDLDDFKLVNDLHGHEVGDLLLCAVADRLRSALRSADAVARLGGDEFVLLVDDGSAAATLDALAARVVGALEPTFEVAGHELTAAGSVGVASSASSDASPEDLLREADVAMYRAKARGGRRWQRFDDALRAEVTQRVRVGDELRSAIGRGELEVHYQPIVALPEASVVRCEALVRWRHPRRGLLLPAAFIPLAEESRLINELGAWVLGEACRQARAWRDAGRDIGVTVNVSTRQLSEPGLVDRVGEALADSGLPAELLCLEVTETTVMESADRAIASLTGLRDAGVRIAMDDFGSGYSSLTYLKSLPLDAIKIDKSFVRGILDSREDRAIVAAILSLARETELLVIGEGVETEALHGELLGLGCRLGQGFLYDRPRPAGELALDGYSSRVRAGQGDPLVIREFMRQIGIPARIPA